MQRAILATVEWGIIVCLILSIFFWRKARPPSVPSSLGNSIASQYLQIHTDLTNQQAHFYSNFFNEFYRYFETEYFPVHQEQRLKVFLFGSPATYRDYVRNQFKNYTPYGSYLGLKKNTIVVNLASGIGTATHELVHHFMAVGKINHYPDWVSEGFPAFFEKFIGYLDTEGKLHISLGYFSNWRFPLTKKVIDKFTLEALFKTRDQNVARSFNLFLHRQGCLAEYIKTLHTGEGRADPVKTLEVTYGADLVTIEHEWIGWVKSQPVDANVRLVERSFILPYPAWVRWWNLNQEHLHWDEEKRLYVVRDS
jgi:hypothetical protein